MRFAGREFDEETGLYYVRARYYDPSVGRFISEDPIGIAGGLNVYAYSNNDPINFSDPTGLEPDGCFSVYTPDDWSRNCPGTRRPANPDYLDPWDAECLFDTSHSEFCSGRPLETPSYTSSPQGNNRTEESCRMKVAQAIAAFAMDASVLIPAVAGARMLWQGRAALNLASRASATYLRGLARESGYAGASLTRNGWASLGVAGKNFGNNFIIQGAANVASLLEGTGSKMDFVPGLNFINRAYIAGSCLLK